MSYIYFDNHEDNNKGDVKGYNKGYTYTKRCSNKSTVRWECVQRRGQACKGALKGKIPKGQKIEGQKQFLHSIFFIKLF